MAPRVDFKHVRQHGSFEAVAAAYNIDLTKDGTKPGQYKGLCPFHEDSKPSLKVNIERNIYNCYPCNDGGNILDFVMALDGVDIRTAALKVADLSGIDPAPGKANRSRPGKSKKQTPPKRTASPEPSSPPPAAETPADEELDGEPYNRVLTFDLKTELDDPLKVWLEGRGIGHWAQKEFGLGRAGKRSKTIADRLAIPIHNAQGQCVAYCGRYVGDDAPADEPKYKLPPGFRKDLEVFNLHRAVKQIDKFKILLAFESYFSVMRFYREAPCVSFMGRSVSPRQVDLMVEHIKGAGFQKVFVVGDGDEPGRQGARDISGALAPHFWTHVLDLKEGEKPHRLEWDELANRLRENW
ncbi:CHC2 zinc finger domain-containing protein [uncultured Roseobacter sp.]|uniref:CHC2 zinc finger domain-containing protein n=1 Tax=uncultured Roseobacter sp. TaxID=114847 RepID=UPI00262ABC51|nr:CHC2 zinc finger domain-containing protein [uncultured Roseobacter sp.]